MTLQVSILQGTITDFNDWVCKQVGHLEARGTIAPDLLTYLWKTYSKPTMLNLYVKILKSEYEDECQDYTAEQLMLLAENKYKRLKQSGKWGKLTEEEAETVALNAKLEVLKNNNKPAKSQNKAQGKND